MAQKEIASARDYMNIRQVTMQIRHDLLHHLHNDLAQWSGTDAMATIRNAYRDAVTELIKAIEAAGDAIQELGTLK
jgi:hypothetical protein